MDTLLATFYRTQHALIADAVERTRHHQRAAYHDRRVELDTVTTELAQTRQAIDRYLIAFEHGAIDEGLVAERLRALQDTSCALTARRDELTAGRTHRAYAQAGYGSAQQAQDAHPPLRTAPARHGRQRRNHGPGRHAIRHGDSIANRGAPHRHTYPPTTTMTLEPLNRPGSDGGSTLEWRI